MKPIEAFKVAFLLRCADEGLTIEQTHQRVKAALAKQALFENMGSVATTIALGAGLGVPAGLGWVGGKLLAESQKDPLTINEAKTNEELAETQRLIDSVRRMKLLRQQQRTIGV